MPYLFDLDGTFYCGKLPLPGGDQLITLLNEKEIPYRFLTNAPENHPEDIEARLRAMGVPLRPGTVVTCAMMAVDLLEELRKTRQLSKINVLGDGDLRRRVRERGFALDEKDPDCVLLSFAREITVGQVQDAAVQIHRGALFVATNPDPDIPNDRGLMPHTGWLIDGITHVTGKQPLMAGKPSPASRDTYTALFRCPPEAITVLGNRLDTDMAYARACGFRSVLILTGATSKEEAEKHRGEYDEVVEDMEAFIRRMNDE